MARSRQSGRRKKRGAIAKEHNSNKRNGNKRRKTEKKFWIEDCPDIKPPATLSDEVAFDVMITRVELTDDYKQVSQASRAIDSSNTSGESADCKSQADYNKQVSQASHVIDSSNTSGESADCKYQADDNKQVSQASHVIDSSNTSGEPADGKSQGEKEFDSQDDFIELPNTQKSKSEVIQSMQDPAPTTFKEVAGTEDEKDNIFSKLGIVVKRTPSAIGMLRNKYKNEDNFKPLPNGDCGDGITNPFPNDEVPDKFWSQRRRLFTRFDSGIQLDRESWYSVTPEAIANHIAAQMVTKLEKKVTILDMFCGCGGNAIAFARRDEVKCVICVDNDLEKLRKATHNARIYEIDSEKMVFIHSGIASVLKCFKGGKLQTDQEPKADGISLHEDSNGYKIGGTDLLPDSIDMTFMSPPWGGINYGNHGKRNFNLGCIKLKEDDSVYNGNELLEQTCEALGNGPLALFLPKNMNGISLGASMMRCGYKGPLVMEQNILNGKLKTITAYTAFA